ncbi:hypothetical protein ACQJBY_032678 [Aegilops geniculata]
MASFPPETTFVWALASNGCAAGSVRVPLDGLLDPGGSMVVRLRCAAHGEGLPSLDEVIQRSDELIGQIGQLPPSAKIVHTMDEISNTRSCAGTRTQTGEWMTSACFLCNNSEALQKSVGFEFGKAANNLRIDFEKGGIHLRNSCHSDSYILLRFLALNLN